MGAGGQEDREGLEQAWGTSRKVRETIQKKKISPMQFSKLLMVSGLVKVGEGGMSEGAGVGLQGTMGVKRHMFTGAVLEDWTGWRLELDCGLDDDRHSF